MAKKKTAPRQPGYSADSTKYCDVCLRDVKIGTGGMKNWDTHLLSTAHVEIVNGVRNPPTQSKPTPTLFSFNFRKGEPPLLPPSTTSAPPLLSQKEIPITSMQPPTTAPSCTQCKPGVPTVLRALFHATHMLPQTVPLASKTDMIATFSSLPLDQLQDGDDLWEDVVNPALDFAIGFGATQQDICDFLRRGDYGMDGMCRYLRSCIVDGQIGAGLLEGKVERLVKAMVSLSAATHGSEGAPSSIEPILVSSRTPSPALQEQAGPVEPEAQPTTRPIPIIPLLKQNTKPCPGYNLNLLTGSSPFAAYPFLLHTRFSLPWKVVVDNDKLFLVSNRCTQKAQTAPGTSKTTCCHYCTRLHDDTHVMGIRHRILEGTHENSAWVYLTPGEMYSVLQRKNKIISNLKLRALNNAHSLGIRNRQIKTWKRLTMAISTSDIPRLNALMSAQVRRGSSVYTILEKVDKAAAREYSPKGYARADFERAYLIYKLGGRSAANIAHRAFGTPSIDATKRHIATTPLRASSGFPTEKELASNLEKCYQDENTGSGQPKFGITIQLDELKVQERLRWDPATNEILGVCREHGHLVSLEFRSIIQADLILEALNEKRVHLSSEATVIGTSILSADPSKYVTRPFGMSGSCKRETVEEQKKLIANAISAVKKDEARLNVSLYCICSDGDSRRRRALIDIAMTRELDSTDNIFPALSPLSLFNTRCGIKGLTIDFDWKHVLKRFRNTAIRQKGFSLAGHSVSTSVLRQHLKGIGGMSYLTLDLLLSPNDKQDVLLMVKLLYSISQLSSSPEPASNNPLSRAMRHILCLLGKLYHNLLSAYLDISLSLHEQLVKLSTAAHIILALYHVDKGNFIPVQSYFDVMCMIKNIYFCVAKAQRDNPGGNFYLILIGTDGLEKVFGKVRSMVGNDTNADVLQLANRIDGAVQCVNILEHHPEWGGEARRLNVKPLYSNDGEITQKYDHLNPAAFTGNLQVSSVVLLGSWNEGRRIAENILKEHGMSPPFVRMEEEGGYDILCPFGKGKMVLVTGLQTGERDETEEEQDTSVVTLTDDSQPLASSNDELLPDIEDLAGVADAEKSENAPEAYISIDPKKPSSKSVHKASILRLYSSPLTINESRDRLKRVRGYSRYNEVKLDPSDQLSIDSNSEETLDVQDPAFTLVECDKSTFLAVIQILGIRHDGKELSSISSALLVEPNVRLHGQIMKVVLVKPDPTAQLGADVHDWEWNGLFEQQGVLRDLRGQFIEQVDPHLQESSHGVTGQTTYAFKTSELRAVAAMMYERLGKEAIPKIQITNSFPYRLDNGDACFVCEKDSTEGDIYRVDGTQMCSHCTSTKIGSMSGQDLLKHMGAHILNDMNLRGAESPCGLCGSVGSVCSIFLSTRAGTVSVDQGKSQCPNIRSIQLKKAEEFSVRQPCTNHPLACPLCPRNAQAVWKYNLKSHLTFKHPTHNASLYEAHWRLHADEENLMKVEWEKSKRNRYRSSKETGVHRLKVSDAHSSRLALRDVTSESHTDLPEENVDNISSGPVSEVAVPYNNGSPSSCIDDIYGPEMPEPTSPEPVINAVALPNASEDLPTTIEPGPSLLAPQDEVPLITGPSPLPSPIIHPSRTRKPKRNMDALIDGPNTEHICHHDMCGLLVSKDELLQCTGCGSGFHLKCRRLKAVPTDDWYCDNECKVINSAVGTRKRRRGGE